MTAATVGRAGAGVAPARTAVERTRTQVGGTVRRGMGAARRALFGAVAPEIAARFVPAEDLPVARRFLADARGWLDRFEAALPLERPRLLRG